MLEDKQATVETNETQAPAESSPATETNGQGNQNDSSPSKDVNSPAPQTEKPVDWRKTPEFRGIAKQNREYKERLEAQDRALAELRGQVQGFRSTQPNSKVSQEDNQTLQRLFSLAFESPEVMDMFKQRLGLGKMDELEKGLSSLSESWNGSQSESEMDSVLSNAKQLGFDEDEVRDTLEQLANEHPVYSQVGYKKGAWKSMYRDHFFDRAGEFRERALNQETIKKREALKAGKTQSTGQGKQSDAAKSADESFGEAFRGGIDFSR